MNKQDNNHQEYLLEREETKGLEKSADKMFEELGYIGIVDDKEVCELRLIKNNRFQRIVIDKNIKTVYLLTYSLTFEELKAINKKVEDLGWEE